MRDPLLALLLTYFRGAALLRAKQRRALLNAMVGGEVGSLFVLPDEVLHGRQPFGYLLAAPLEPLAS